MMQRGWIGVDLDGTLARYDHTTDFPRIGEPIPAMIERVREWLAEGIEVRIVTARVDDVVDRMADADAIDYVEADQKARRAIMKWCQRHIGCVLPVTNCKDYQMVALYDDRARQVELNTGRLIGENS